MWKENIYTALFFQQIFTEHLLIDKTQNLTPLIKDEIEYQPSREA